MGSGARDVTRFMSLDLAVARLFGHLQQFTPSFRAAPFEHAQPPRSFLVPLQHTCLPRKGVLGEAWYGSHAGRGSGLGFLNCILKRIVKDVQLIFIAGIWFGGIPMYILGFFVCQVVSSPVSFTYVASGVFSVHAFLPVGFGGYSC